MVSSILCAGLVGCLTEQDGPLAVTLSQSCRTCLRLCPPHRTVGDALTVSSCVRTDGGR